MMFFKKILKKIATKIENKKWLFRIFKNQQCLVRCFKK